LVASLIGGKIKYQEPTALMWIKSSCYMWQSKREISRECNDKIGSAKGSQISEIYWGEVGKISLSPIRHRFAPGFVIYKKGCIRLTATSDKVYQLLAHGRWFSLGTPASSTTKTGRHDIAAVMTHKIFDWLIDWLIYCVWHTRYLID
jgi:hypothetical protein